MPSSTSLPPPASTIATTLATVAGLLALASYLDLHISIPFQLPSKKKIPKVSRRCYTPSDPSISLATFKILTSQTTQKQTYPLSTNLENNIPIYDCTHFDPSITDNPVTPALQDEFHHILLHGPGVLVLRKFFPPSTHAHTIDAASKAFDQILTSENLQAQSSGKKKGDHFSPSQTNSRLWNSFSKHCLSSPESFLAYYSNPWFRVVSEAYLGPGYRITTQLNVVRPGGKPQVSHRDYHLGFQTEGTTAEYPKEMHAASALLTLQGAVAHSDMPVESGPTRLLPFSQMFEAGFMAYRQEEFDEYFLRSYVSIGLEKGDAVFFSPALFHAAGENRTVDVQRSANLVQVSSAFGKTMETVDSLPLVERSWRGLVEMNSTLGKSAQVDAFVRAVAEGYPFPTNLDRRPPAPGGMAPESEQDILRRGLSESWDTARVMSELTSMREAAAS